MARRPRGHPSAIIRPTAAHEAFQVNRYPPRESLAEFVDYHWLVRWRVPAPYRQRVVPQPRVHVAAETGVERMLVHGVSRAPFHRTLTGTGLVLGAAFHPGGFRPVLRAGRAAAYAGAGVSRLTGRPLPAADVLGIDDAAATAAILADGADADLVRVLEDQLERLAPQPDPTARMVTALVAEAETRTEIARAEQLARHAAISLRTLQRLFTEYVGIGPKWVIQRFRLLEATAAAHHGEVDWAELADRLGFSDQAHLTRVFTQVVGTPPARYQRDPRT